MTKDIGPLLSSEYQEWETPRGLFDQLDQEFNFTLDAAASAESTKCGFYIDKETDALKVNWCGRVFLNPPYGTRIGEFLKKAYMESLENAEVVVCLIPSRTDTIYWHEYVMKAAEIRFIKGRVRFGARLEGQLMHFSTAVFPSAVIIFRRGIKREHPLVISMVQQQDEKLDAMDVKDVDLEGF